MMPLHTMPNPTRNHKQTSLLDTTRAKHEKRSVHHPCVLVVMSRFWNTPSRHEATLGWVDAIIWALPSNVRIKGNAPITVTEGCLLNFFIDI